MYQAGIRYALDGMFCLECNLPLLKLGDGLAHRLSKSKVNLKKYGERIINHNFNLCPACFKDNQKFLIDNKPMRIIKLVNLIRERGEERLTSREINKILEG
jgi:hypothetical protein